MNTDLTNQIYKELQKYYGHEAKTTVNFGKVAYWGNRKENKVTVEIRLRAIDQSDGNYYLEFAASGAVWNRLGTDWLTGDQMLDQLTKFKQITNDPNYKAILRLWQLYHLNSMNVGTPEQTKAIKEWEADGNRYDYDAACQMLKGKGLYEVPFYGRTTSKSWNGELYRYGTGWVVNDIPDDDLREIATLLNLTI